MIVLDIDDIDNDSHFPLSMDGGGLPAKRAGVRANSLSLSPLAISQGDNARVCALPPEA